MRIPKSTTLYYEKKNIQPLKALLEEVHYATKT